MIDITTRAEDLLLRLRESRGRDRTAGARFVTQAGKVRLTFVPAAKPRDRILEGARLPIFIAPELAEAFHEATIDADETDGKRALVVTRGPREGQGPEPRDEGP